jgi:hypothetical protein
VSSAGGSGLNAHAHQKQTVLTPVPFVASVLHESINGKDRLCGLVVRVHGYRSRGRDRFPALPDFMRSNGSGMRSTEPREYN